jgi:hypothetical protein
MLHKTLNILFIGMLVLFIVSCFRKGILPEKENIVPSMYNDPIQEETEKTPFTVDYMGTTYTIKPVASYELWGLVVSHNKTRFVFDIYHDKSSYDTKDIAVIYGKNISNNDYKKMDYWSGGWTGYCRTKKGMEYVKFDGKCISNNHLITSEQSIRDKIKEIQIGDQIHIKGMLVNYTHPDWKGYERKSSLKRDDSGCEVIFVEEIERLQKGTPEWYEINLSTLQFMIIILVVKIALLLI